MDGETNTQMTEKGGGGMTAFFIVIIILIIAGIAYVAWGRGDQTDGDKDDADDSMMIDDHKPQDVFTGETKYGPTLTDAKGQTLYFYSKDSNGTTTCYGTCATNWPPYVSSATSSPDSDVSVISRTDGTSQLAYKGMPLYYWKDDAAPGDVLGHGVNKVWAIARPSGEFDLSTSTGSMMMEIDPNAKVFDITGKNYSYSESEIRVKKGDTVVINFESVGGFHDWVVDEFKAKTDRVNPGEKTSVTFEATKTGTFEFYCSVGQHRALGMVGKLIVE